MAVARGVLGAALGVLSAWSLGRFILRRGAGAIRCACGAALLSLVGFVLFAAGLAKLPAILLVEVLCLAPTIWLRPVKPVLQRPGLWSLLAIVYAGLYLFYTLQPETQAD